jgi:hypothetical protein
LFGKSDSGEAPKKANRAMSELHLRDDPYEPSKGCRLGKGEGWIVLVCAVASAVGPAVVMFVMHALGAV